MMLPGSLHPSASARREQRAKAEVYERAQREEELCRMKLEAMQEEVEALQAKVGEEGAEEGGRVDRPRLP